MRNIFFILLLFPLLISNQAHKFYVSTTQVEYSEKSQSLQIISRIFIDDLEKTLEDTYHVRAYLESEKEDPKTDEYIADYYQTHFFIYINGERKMVNFLGKTYEDGSAKSYLEVQNISKNDIKSIKIRSLLLLKNFDNQKNIIHLKIGNLKKSFVLTADQPSETITIK